MLPIRPSGHVAAAPGLPLPIEVPPIVRAAGEKLWHDEQLPELGVSGYERRALHRAALIYLAAQRGKAAFSVALVAQWRHLFGARWSQTENHRGLREVLRWFDASLCNDAVRGWVLGVVEA